MSTAIHEASHAACAIFLGRHVDHVLVEPGLPRAGEQIGHARIPIGERIESSQMMICLIGYLSDGTPGWPPAFADALDEDREALGKVLRRLGANEEAYEASVQLARDMLADPDFRRLRDALARALSAVPRLDTQAVEALCKVHGFPTPEKETAA